jgi:DNA-binding NtrC family response regulator
MPERRAWAARRVVFVQAFIERIGKGGPGLSRDAQEVLRSYRWPSNIRELANAVERSLILSTSA